MAVFFTIATSLGLISKLAVPTWAFFSSIFLLSLSVSPSSESESDSESSSPSIPSAIETRLSLISASTRPDEGNRGEGRGTGGWFC